MSPLCTKGFRLGLSFPRVSGDEPQILDFQRRQLGFSPRERG